jgi:hypothetical protein
MEKLITVCTLFIFAMTAKVSAQQFVARLTTTGLKEGANTVIVTEFKGTLKFVKRGSTFLNVVFLDSLGNSFAMQSTGAGTNGAPKPECKSKIT